MSDPVRFGGKDFYVEHHSQGVSLVAYDGEEFRLHTQGTAEEFTSFLDGLAARVGDRPAPSGDLRLGNMSFRAATDGVLLDVEGVRDTVTLRATPGEWARVANWMAALAAGKVGDGGR